MPLTENYIIVGGIISNNQRSIARYLAYAAAELGADNYKTIEVNLIETPVEEVKKKILRCEKKVVLIIHDPVEDPKTGALYTYSSLNFDKIWEKQKAFQNLFKFYSLIYGNITHPTFAYHDEPLLSFRLERHFNAIKEAIDN